MVIGISVFYFFAIFWRISDVDCAMWVYGVVFIVLAVPCATMADWRHSFGVVIVYVHRMVGRVAVGSFARVALPSRGAMSMFRILQTFEVMDLFASSL